MNDPDQFVQIEGVTKRFGDVVAVDNISFNIKQGEFFSLLGSSGCGKTTLLRMIAGLETPSAGEIYIDGVAMSEVPPYQRPTNMVFQNYAIFPHLDVQSNIAYGLRKHKLSKSIKKERVDEALEMVKLGGYGSRRAHELSGGQRQRVALARALIMRPKVLLLDEPLGALDKKLRQEMQLELRMLQESVGITFIFVTHDQEEAMTLSDRVAVMANGKVLQNASPKTLYGQPNSVEVASFIGQMNFIEATALDTSSDTVRMKSKGLGDIQVVLNGSRIQPGEEMVVAVRPEKLSISREKTLNYDICIPGVIKNSVYLGDRSQYFVSVDGHDKPLEVIGTDIEGTSEQVLHRGSEVWLSCNKESLNLLAAS